MPDTMPIGATMTLPIRESQVQTTEGNTKPPDFDNDANAVLVWENYQKAKNYVENNAWLLEWQETDILYQSPIPNRFMRVEEGRPPRIPRFLVAKFSRTLAQKIKRALFAEQVPFFLRPVGKTTQKQVDAWTALLSQLLKRMKFKYHGGLLINCQVLQGTGIGKVGWQEKTTTKWIRKRTKQPMKVDLPVGSKEVPTVDSDGFQLVPEETKESWPFFEYRRLGTTLYDPKWCTPDQPEESAKYCVDVDYVDFYDLQEMRKLDCYENMPTEEVMKRYFFGRQEGSAPAGSQVEDSMTAQGSMVTHAEGRNKQTSADPMQQPLMLLEQWDDRTVKTILCYDGRKLLIRDEEHKAESMCHPEATWWPIDNNGYGMGIGRLTGPDQRINQGVLNACLRMIAYPFNAPIVVGRGENAPTQNVINRLGGFWQVDAGPSGDVRKAVGFMEMPEVPGEAWKMLDLTQRGGEELSGADNQFTQGNRGGPGSSTTRTATGVNKIGMANDQNIADPVDSFADGVIVPVIEFLIRMVKQRMPLKEIRAILSVEHAAIIQSAIKQDQFLSAEMEVSVLAGQKLLARQGIQQLIPLFLQILQQPQLLQFLHERGQTIDFEVMMDLMVQVSDLMEQPDIFRNLTDDEKEFMKMMNPGMQKVQGQIGVEKVKGQNKKEEIQTKGQVDLANKSAEIAMEHISEGIPLTRATGLLERGEDVQALRSGISEPLEQ